jgi:hypothetical protein
MRGRFPPAGFSLDDSHDPSCLESVMSARRHRTTARPLSGTGTCFIMPDPDRKDDPGATLRPPPGWMALCRLLPGFVAGAFGGGLFVALLLTLDVAGLRTLLTSADHPPRWNLFLSIPLLFGLLGMVIAPSLSASVKPTEMDR